MGERKAIPAQLRFDVLKRDGFTCQYCGHSAPSVKLHVDHLIPVRSGGTNALWNLIAACEGCNLGKSAGNLQELLQVRLIVRNRYAQRFHEDIRDFMAWPMIMRASQHFTAAEIADLAVFHETFRNFMCELECWIAGAEIPVEPVA